MIFPRILIRPRLLPRTLWSGHFQGWPPSSSKQDPTLSPGGYKGLMENDKRQPLRHMQSGTLGSPAWIPFPVSVHSLTPLELDYSFLGFLSSKSMGLGLKLTSYPVIEGAQWQLSKLPKGGSVVLWLGAWALTTHLGLKQGFATHYCVTLVSFAFSEE